jgi:hypothetical protein
MFKVWGEGTSESGRDQSVGLVAINNELCGISGRLPTYSRNCPDDWVVGHMAFVNDRPLPLVLRGVAKASFKSVSLNGKGKDDSQGALFRVRCVGCHGSHSLFRR